MIGEKIKITSCHHLSDRMDCEMTKSCSHCGKEGLDFQACSNCHSAFYCSRECQSKMQHNCFFKKGVVSPNRANCDNREGAKNSKRTLETIHRHQETTHESNEHHGPNDIVRIVILSDTHGLHEHLQLLLPPGNVLIHCGDFANRGSLIQIRKFRDWFSRQTQFTDRIVIAGNHDRDLSNPDTINLEKEFAQVPKAACIHFLQDEHLLCANGRLRVFGTSWKTCEERTHRDLNLRDEDGHLCDILLSHMPPYYPDYDVNSVKKGSIGLANKAFRERIPITCGGHLHWARGAVRYDDEEGKSCWFLNASSQKPMPAGRPLPKGEAPVFPPVVMSYSVKRRVVTRMEGLSIRNGTIPSQFRGGA